MAERPVDFTGALKSILECLDQQHIPHVLIGGIAVSQLSEPRATADIDLLVLIGDDDRIGDLAEAAKSCGSNSCPIRSAVKETAVGGSIILSG